MPQLLGFAEVYSEICSTGFENYEFPTVV